MSHNDDLYEECDAGVAGGCGACRKCDPEWWENLRKREEQKMNVQEKRCLRLATYEYGGCGVCENCDPKWWLNWDGYPVHGEKSPLDYLSEALNNLKEAERWIYVTNRKKGSSIYCTDLGFEKRNLLQMEMVTQEIAKRANRLLMLIDGGLARHSHKEWEKMNESKSMGTSGTDQ